MQANGAAVIAVPTAKMVNHAAETNLPIFFEKASEWWSIHGGEGKSKQPLKKCGAPTSFVKMGFFKREPGKNSPLICQWSSNL